MSFEFIKFISTSGGCCGQNYSSRKTDILICRNKNKIFFFSLTRNWLKHGFGPLYYETIRLFDCETWFQQHLSLLNPTCGRHPFYKQYTNKLDPRQLRMPKLIVSLSGPQSFSHRFFIVFIAYYKLRLEEGDSFSLYNDLGYIVFHEVFNPACRPFSYSLRVSFDLKCYNRRLGIRETRFSVQNIKYF